MRRLPLNIEPWENPPFRKSKVVNRLRLSKPQRVQREAEILCFVRETMGISDHNRQCGHSQSIKNGFPSSLHPKIYKGIAKKSQIIEEPRSSSRDSQPARFFHPCGTKTHF
jgi:hypothetical protein